MAQVLFAPNPELCALLERSTGRPCHLMPRGVDSELFHPAKRRRDPGDRDQVLGFVGRLSIEKNVALLARVQEELEKMGQRIFRFLIVGHGAEESGCASVCRAPNFPACCSGEELARPTPAWTCLSSPRIPIPLATWCWRRWPAAFRPS